MEAVFRQKIEIFEKSFKEKVEDIDQISSILLEDNSSSAQGNQKEKCLDESEAIDHKLYSLPAYVLQEKQKLEKIADDLGELYCDLEQHKLWIKSCSDY